MDKKYLQHSILETAYNSKQWRSVMEGYFGARNFLIQPKSISLPANDFAEGAFELGNFHTADERLVGIYEVKLNPKAWIERNRVGLRKLLRQVYKYDVDAALIVFVQADKWRFSYVSEIRTEEGKKETEPKRYTYLFGNGEICRTAADRFDKLKGKPVYLNDLFDAFNVEKLNKEFFKTYKEFYQKGVSEIVERKSFYKLLIDKTQEDDEKKEKPIRDFVKKMLGRIVFLHFLQKKGWMGVEANNKNWNGGDIKFLQNLFANTKHKNNFHTTALRTLFFETLNTKRKNDLAPTALNDGIKLPYLNGGLFDKDNSFYNDIDFTADYFKNLLEFFEQYNFTIDENDPYDNEVGIDPEMLGHIFENLLEENKDKGAFYTPKEVVHYMCQESLIQYLRTHLPECTEDESPATIALQNFIRNGMIGERTDKKNFVVQQAKRIERLLDHVKICDPAIGSGAFPMGMLQEIYKAKTNLDLTLDHTEVKKQIIQNCIYGVDIENGAVEIARLRFWLALVVDETTPQPLPNLDYKIMQGNSLLESFEGVDLSNLADMEKEETFFSANKVQLELGSEFSAKKQSMLVFDEKSKLQLYELISDYYSYDETANTKYKSKQFIKDEINKIVEGKLIAKFYLQKPKAEQKIKDTQTAIKGNRLMAADAPGVRQRKEKNIEKLNRELADREKELVKLNDIIEHLHELQTRTDKPYFLWHLWFKEVFDKGGFDIVIGNPPYIEFKKLEKEMKIHLEEQYLTTKGKYDLYIPFIEFSKNLLKKKGYLIYICPTRFMHRDYGKTLREFIATNFTTVKIIDFGDGQIFDDAMTYTGIFSFKNSIQEKHFDYTKLLADNKDKFENLNFQSIDKSELKSATWYFDNVSNELIKKIQKETFSLESITSGILQGIATGKDSVFIVDNETIQEYNLENKLLHKILKGKDISPFKINWSKKYLIYTYDNDGNVIEEKVLKTDFPNTYKYLISKKGELSGRDYFDNSNKLWFELWNQRNLRKYQVEKLITLDNASKNSFAYDDRGFVGTTTTYSIIPKGIDAKYLLGILNSKLLCYYHMKNTIPQAGGFYRYQALFIKDLPLKTGSGYSKNIIGLVNKIIEKREESIDSSNYENKIDALVFHLYGLSESEMLQVLDTFKDLSIKDRNRIQNEYWNIANNKFKTEA